MRCPFCGGPVDRWAKPGSMLTRTDLLFCPRDGAFRSAPSWVARNVRKDAPRVAVKELAR